MDAIQKLDAIFSGIILFLAFSIVPSFVVTREIIEIDAYAAYWGLVVLLLGFSYRVALEYAEECVTVARIREEEEERARAREEENEIKIEKWNDQGSRVYAVFVAGGRRYSRVVSGRRVRELGRRDAIRQQLKIGRFA